VKQRLDYPDKVFLLACVIAALLVGMEALWP
jgi:hypothetical protein